MREDRLMRRAISTKAHVTTVRLARSHSLRHARFRRGIKSTNSREELPPPPGRAAARRRPTPLRSTLDGRIVRHAWGVVGEYGGAEEAVDDHRPRRSAGPVCDDDVAFRCELSVFSISMNSCFDKQSDCVRPASTTQMNTWVFCASCHHRGLRCFWPPQLDCRHVETDACEPRS
jgi:hypothetical protein